MTSQKRLKLHTTTGNWSPGRAKKENCALFIKSSWKNDGYIAKIRVLGALVDISGGSGRNRTD